MLFLTNFHYSPSSAVQGSDEPFLFHEGAGVLHQGGEHFQSEANRGQGWLVHPYEF